MLKLLEIELRKLVPYRFFWISVAAYALLMPALFISIHNFKLNIRGMEFSLDFYNFPYVWHNATYIAKWFNFLLYVFVLQVVTNEYQFRTIRQNIIDGLSPWQYLGGKVMLVMFFAAGSTLLVGVLSLLSGLFLAEAHDMSQMWDKAGYLGLYFLQLLGYLSLALLIGTLVRKAGMAILAFASYTLIVESVLRYAFFMKDLQPEIWGPYLPTQPLGSLISNPLPWYLQLSMGINADPPPGADPKMVALSLAYTAAFIGISGWLIARKDL